MTAPRENNRDFTLLFLVMLITGAGNTALQSILPTLGRTIGVPTANLSRIEVMLPANGVYAARATLPDGTRRLAAVNIGTRPTVNGSARRVEAHLIKEQGEVGDATSRFPEYGWNLSLHLHSFVRDELRFASLDALKEQIGRDIARIRTVLERKEPAWT